MSQALLYRPRRTAQSDPRLGHTGMFDVEINARLAEELPAATRHSYFNRATMPRHWLDAILENQPSYRAREKGVALDLRGLPASMVTEFAWSIERQVQLGMRIQAEYTTKLTHQHTSGSRPATSHPAPPSSAPTAPPSASRPTTPSTSTPAPTTSPSTTSTHTMYWRARRRSRSIIPDVLT